MCVTHELEKNWRKKKWYYQVVLALYLAASRDRAKESGSNIICISCKTSITTLPQPNAFWKYCIIFIIILSRMATNHLVEDDGNWKLIQMESIMLGKKLIYKIFREEPFARRKIWATINYYFKKIHCIFPSSFSLSNMAINCGVIRCSFILFTIH